MAITRNNYEVWFVDRLDGQLNAASCEAMDKFLAKHPDLAAEWASWSGEAWTAARVEPKAEARFPQRETLYRQPRAKRRIIAWWPAAALAAALAAAWFVFGLDQNGQPDSLPDPGSVAKVDQASTEDDAASPVDAAESANGLAGTGQASTESSHPGDNTAALQSTDALLAARENTALAEKPATQDASQAPAGSKVQSPAGQRGREVLPGDAALASMVQDRKPASTSPKGNAAVEQNHSAPVNRASQAQPLEPIAASDLANGSRMDDAAYAALTQARVLQGELFAEADDKRFPRVESFLDRLPPGLQRAGERTVEAADELAEAVAGESPFTGRRENQHYIFEFEAGPLRITHRKTTKSDS